ncbi:hypothetical protein BDV06DRAFT_219272 [Aspergillus oleicola]
MLRSKPTRIALTEDDLCYHIDSIFSRNEQLTKWHQQRTGSGNSYDGDDDEDGLFYDSDSFSVPETFYESECEETQSQPLTGGNPQETESRPGNRNTSTAVSSRRRRPVTVRFASPEPSPSTPTRSRNRDRNHNSVAIVRSERTEHFIHPAHARSTHPRPIIPQSFLANTDWRRIKGAFPLHDLTPQSLILPSSGQSRPTEVVLQASLASLLSSITALPISISGREGAVESFENSRRAPLPGLSSMYPGTKAVFPPEMKPFRPTKSVAIARTSNESGSSEDHTPEPTDGGCLTEKASNSGSATLQLPSPNDARKRSSRRRLSTFKETASSGNQEERSQDSRSSYYNTISRATQTSPDLAPPIQHEADDAPHDLDDHALGYRENVSLSETTEQPTDPRHWQDLFVSAMFPEPDAPEYDAMNQIRRGMQGYINVPGNRGRGARNERGQLVHPTLVDATFFQEYVHQLIAELDRAP